MEARELKNLIRELRTLVLSGKIKEAIAFYWRNIHDEVEKKFLENVQERKKQGEIPEYQWLIIPASNGSFLSLEILFNVSFFPRVIFFGYDIILFLFLKVFFFGKRKAYSYLKASTGFSLEARTAGSIHYTSGGLWEEETIPHRKVYNPPQYPRCRGC